MTRERIERQYKRGQCRGGLGRRGGEEGRRGEGRGGEEREAVLLGEFYRDRLKREKTRHR